MVQTSSPPPPTVVVHRDCVACVGDCVCRAACVNIAVIVLIVCLKEKLLIKQFLATLVALHFTPISESVGES